MTSIEPQPALQPPHPPFQFSLRTLLLLFVVLGSSLGVFGMWGIVVFVLVIGVAICVHQGGSCSVACVALFVLGLIGLFAMQLPGGQVGREIGRRVSCANNLKQIALALQQYHQANGSFPPAYITDKSGKPNHSWRAMIMPYLDRDESTVYKFAEPWNGPTNKLILAYGIESFYACPNDATMLQNAVLPMGALQTSYFAVVGPNAAWAGAKSRKLADFGEDASSTIMLIEVNNSGITWSEPRDLSLDTFGTGDAESPALIVASHHLRRKEFFFTSDDDSCVNVAMADGSVRLLDTAGLSNEDLRKLLQIGGCKEEQNRIHDPSSARRRLNWPNIGALAVWLLSVGTLLTLAVRSRKRSSVPPPPAC